MNDSWVNVKLKEWEARSCITDIRIFFFFTLILSVISNLSVTVKWTA